VLGIKSMENSISLGGSNPEISSGNTSGNSQIIGSSSMFESFSLSKQKSIMNPKTPSLKEVFTWLAVKNIKFEGFGHSNFPKTIVFL